MNNTMSFVGWMLTGYGSYLLIKAIYTFIFKLLSITIISDINMGLLFLGISLLLHKEAKQ